MNQFWLGTEQSFRKVFDTAELYAGQMPAPIVSAATFADQFHTTNDRIGLMLLDRSGTTGIIYAHGAMVDSHRWWHSYEVGYVTSYAAIKDAVDILMEDKTITRIVLNVESNGGMVSGIHSVSEKIRKAARKKEIVAHTDTGALSAGYWLAASTSQVTADKMAGVGSIGVIAIYTDYSKQAEEYGIKFHVFTAGKEKGYGFGGTEFSDEEKTAIQSSIDKTYNFFLTHVAKNRDLSLRNKEEWADAKILYAGEAKAVGLVDGIFNLEDIIGGKSAVKSNSNKKGAKAMLCETLLARIAAGESPETVLTPEQLAIYMENYVDAENEPEVPTVEAEGSEGEGEGEPEVEGGGEPEAQPAVSPIQAELTQMARDLGRAEAKAEAMAEEVESLKGQLAATKESLNSLVEVAQASVKNLQVAMSLPQEKSDSPEAILAQYQELQARFTSRFQAGRNSSAKNDTKELDLQARIPNPNRPE